MDIRPRTLGEIGDDAWRCFRWFEQAIADFADRKKEDALRILDDLQQRLLLLEDSLTPPDQSAAQAREKHTPEDIKSLLRGSESRKVEREQPRQRIEEDRSEIRREEDHEKKRQGEAPLGGGVRGTPVPVPAARNSGFSLLGWLLLGGSVVKQLGLPLASKVKVRYADGRTRTRDTVQSVQVEIQGRWDIFSAIVEPSRSEALIGAIILEDLDFLVDCLHQRLVPRDPRFIISPIEAI